MKTDIELGVWYADYLIKLTTNICIYQYFLRKTYKWRFSHSVDITKVVLQVWGKFMGHLHIPLIVGFQQW